MSRSTDLEKASALFLEYLEWAKSIGATQKLLEAHGFHQWLTEQLRSVKGTSDNGEG